MRLNPPVIVLAALGVAACADSPPPIGKDLPKLMSDARPAFDQRVKERFPVGSDESVLLAEMHRENFTVTPGRANREFSTIVCRVFYTISWAAEQNKISSIGGEYGQTCL